MNEQAAEPNNLSASVSDVFGGENEPTQQPTPQETPGEGQGEPGAGQPQPRTGEPTPPTTFPTPEQITASVREGLRQSTAETPAAPKQYTAEELDQLFNVWKPSAELVQRIRDGGDDGLRAMLEIRDGLSKQFGTLLQYQIELARRELVNQMNPALTFVAEAAAAADREDFFSQNEDLRAHELLTQTVFNALKQEGYRATNKEEAFKTLADRTRALIPTSGNGSGAAQSGSSRTTTKPNERRPASLSSGSQAGGGGGSAPQVPFPGAEVFL